MGLQAHSQKTFLRVSLGKIRQKVDKQTPNAEERKTDYGVVYEFVFNALSGTLENIYFKEHAEFGNSWNVTITDTSNKETKTYVLQVQEESKYCDDLLKKLPHLHVGDLIELKPYDFDTKEGKHVSGLSIKRLGSDEKLMSYYHEYDGEVSKPINGFPEFTPKSKDKKKNKDEWKIFKIQARTFLRERSLAYLAEQFQHAPSEDSKDGLPF